MTYRDNATGPEPDRSILVVGLNECVIGLDRLTGAIRWEHKIGSGSSLIRGEVSLSINYGVVVASGYWNEVVCLDYLTGALRWSVATRQTGRATILLEPDQVVCIKDGYVDCYSPTGQHLWQQPLTGRGVGRGALGYPGNVAQADDIGTE